MEKSIESVWKSGFSNQESLQAPKINDFYNQRSKHLIDKLQRMFIVNLVLIVVVAVLVMIISYSVGIPYMGIGLMFVFVLVVIVNTKLKKSLGAIDKSDNSYLYVKSFDAWIRRSISINMLMARFYYPLIFLSIVLGFWFKENEEGNLGETFISYLLIQYPELSLVSGVPVLVLLAIVVPSLILFFIGGKIYLWDMNLVYKRALSKLSKLIYDMESLRS